VIVLTPELASAMLKVWQRRQRDPQGMPYDSSVLECALYGLPDFAPIHRGQAGYQRVPGWRFEAPRIKRRP